MNTLRSVVSRGLSSCVDCSLTASNAVIGRRCCSSFERARVLGHCQRTPVHALRSELDKAKACICPVSTGSCFSHKFGSARNMSRDTREQTCHGDVRCQEIKSMGSQKVKDLLDSIDTFIFDCDGVVWLGDKVFPEAAEFISLLRQMGKRIFFITNNSIRTLAEIQKLFRRDGIEIQEEDIVFPSITLAHHLKSIGFKDKIELIGSPSLREQLKSSGIQVVDDEKHTRHVATIPEFMEGIILEDSIKAVAVDVDLNCNYMKVTRVLTLLKDPNCLYFSLAPDRKIPLSKSVITAGPGVLLEIIKEFTGRVPHVLGKPATDMFDLLNEKHSINPQRTLFIGDSIYTDVALGRKCGLKTMLVLSGHSKRCNIPLDDELNQPHYIGEHLGDFLPYMKSAKSQ